MTISIANLEQTYSGLFDQLEQRGYRLSSTGLTPIEGSDAHPLSLAERGRLVEEVAQEVGAVAVGIDTSS